MNHDISVGEMIDKEDEERIGLLGRDPQIQFVRLASAFNEQKRVLGAAIRLMKNEYIHWNRAGGVDECDHGYSAGIQCPHCDAETVKAYSANTSREAR